MALVLVVEDNATVAALMREILTEEGYTVVIAPDGATGLRQLQTLRPGLIITEARLLGMNGLAFCRAVRDNPATVGIPIILASTAKEDGIAGQCDYAAFLPKPFALTTLLQLVERLYQPDSALIGQA